MEDKEKNGILSTIKELAFNYSVRKNDIKRGKKFEKLYDVLEQKKDKISYDEMLKIYYTDMIGIINGRI